MEISSQRTGGPSDWLQLCTFFFQWGICDVRTGMAEGWRRRAPACWGSRAEKHRCCGSVFYTGLYRISSPSRVRGKMLCDCFAVCPLSAPLGIPRSVSAHDLDSYSAVLYLCVLQPSPGLRSSRDSEVVAAHSGSVTWKCSWMKWAFPRDSTAVSDTPTETPPGRGWISSLVRWITRT